MLEAKTQLGAHRGGVGADATGEHDGVQAATCLSAAAIRGRRPDRA
jgi:hypothetical protein